MRKQYPSDIRREQLASILLPGKGTQEDDTTHGGVIRGVLRRALCVEKRLPVADAACGFSDVADVLRIFSAMERQTRRTRA